ncbi:hypothetical protein SBA1_670021 [Candidatus Sulfotelmatobacter kueseliae]|uniref:Transposase n=1 Tax=Candidatus Sulfotelmatobacter kueseliae TaxID=2042962 RepID=A0A2U3L3W5_9BACT|nr:hypothetical protein SBA1_670021 [Candidatus Sulfotelmatobacter kueseliae]
MRVRYEKRADIHEAFLSLGCALICWHMLRVLAPILSATLAAANALYPCRWRIARYLGNWHPSASG